MADAAPTELESNPICELQRFRAYGAGVPESQRSSIPQPRVGPSRTGDPPSYDSRRRCAMARQVGATSELPWVIRQTQTA